MEEKTQKIYEFLQSKNIKNLPQDLDSFSSKMAEDEELRGNVYGFLSGQNIKNFPKSQEEFSSFFFDQPNQETPKENTESPSTTVQGGSSLGFLDKTFSPQDFGIETQEVTDKTTIPSPVLKDKEIKLAVQDGFVQNVSDLSDFSKQSTDAVLDSESFAKLSQTSEIAKTLKEDIEATPKTLKSQKSLDVVNEKINQYNELVGQIKTHEGEIENISREVYAQNQPLLTDLAGRLSMMYPDEEFLIEEDGLMKPTKNLARRSTEEIKKLIKQSEYQTSEITGSSVIDTPLAKFNDMFYGTVKLPFAVASTMGGETNEVYKFFDDLQNESKKINSDARLKNLSQEQIDKGIFENMADGDYTSAAKNLGFDILNTIPQIAVAAFSPNVMVNNAGRLGLSAATEANVIAGASLNPFKQGLNLGIVSMAQGKGEDSYNQAIEEGFTPAQATAISTFKTAATLVSESLFTKDLQAIRGTAQGRKLADDIIKNKKEVIKSFRSSIPKETLEGGGEEGFEELFEGIIDGVVDYVSKGEAINPYKLADQVVVGMASGGGSSAFRQIKSLASVVRTDANILKKQKILQEIKNLIDKGELSPSEIEVLEGEKTKIKENLAKYSDAENKKINSLSDEAKEEYISLSQEIAEKLDTVKEMPEGMAKDLLKEDIEKSIGKRDDLLENAKQINKEAEIDASFDDEIDQLEAEVAKEERIIRDRTQPNRKPLDKSKTNPDAQKKITAMEMLGQKVQDKDGVVGTIQEENGGVVWVSEDGNKVRDGGSKADASTVTLDDMLLSLIPEKPSSPVKLNEGEQAETQESKAQVKAKRVAQEELDVMTDIEFEEAQAKADKDVAEVEDQLIKQAVKESTNERLAFKVGEKDVAVRLKPDGTYSVSQKNDKGKYVGIKDEAARNESIAEYNTIKEGKDSQRLEDAQSLSAEFRKEQDDKVLSILDKLIDSTSTKGRLFDASLGLPMFVANSSLKVVRAAYKAGKSLAEAIQEGIKHIKAQGHTVNELDYKKFVISESKKKPTTAKVEPNPVAKPTAKKPTKPETKTKAESTPNSQTDLNASLSEAITNPTKKDVKQSIRKVFLNLKIKIDAAKVSAIARKAIGVTTQDQLESFLDYANKVVNNATFLQSINKVKALQKAVNKKIKAGNLPVFGSKDLLAFKVNPEKLTDIELNDYVDFLTKANKKGVNVEAELGNQIQGFSDIYESPEKIEKKQASDKTLKDEDGLREDILKKIKDIKPDDMVNIPDELFDSATQIANIKAEDLKGLDKAKLQELQFAIEGVLDGREITNKGYTAIRSVVQNKGENEVNLVLKGARFKTLLRNFLSKFKSGDKTKVYSKYLDSTVMAKVDNAIVGGLKRNGRAIYKNLIEPISTALSVYQGALSEIDSKIDKHIGSGKNKISNKNLPKVSAKLAMIGLAKQKAKNPTAEELSDLSDYIKAIKEDGKNDNNYRKRAEMYAEVYDSMLDGDKKFDWQKQYDNLSQAEKNLFDEIESIMLSNSDKARNAAVKNGEAVVIYDFYNPINVAVFDVSNIKELEKDAENFGTVGNISKSSNLINRSDSSGELIILDIVGNARSASASVLRNYYMREPLKTIKGIITKLKKSNDNNAKDFISAIEAHINIQTEHLFINSLARLDKTEALSEWLDTAGYMRDLLSVGRSAVEFATNIEHALIFVGLPTMTDGMQVMSENDLDDVAQMLRVAKTTHFPRLMGKQGTARAESSGVIERASSSVGKLRDKLSDVFLSAPDAKVARTVWLGVFKKEFEKRTGEKLNVKDFLGQGKKYHNETREARLEADNIVIESFATFNAYEGISGAQLNKKANFLQKANRYMVRFQMSEFQSILDGLNAAVGRGDLTPVQGMRLVVATLARMTTYNLALHKVNTVIIGAIAAGIGLLAGIDTPENDDERTLLEKIKQDSIRATMGTLVSLAFFRRLRNFKRIPIAMGIETLNIKYGEGILRKKGEEYDSFKDALIFSPFLTGIGFGKEYKDPNRKWIDAIATLTGPKNKLVKGISNFVYFTMKGGLVEDGIDVPESISQDPLLKGSLVKKESRDKNRKIARANLLDAALSATAFPFTRDIMSLVNMFVYDDIKKKSGGSKVSSRN